jgi:F0F1-type ATP synthase membrane subunit b/b'
MNETGLYLQIAIWSQVISSIVFIAALVILWVRWLQPVFLAAQERSNRQISEAERHRSEAKAALDLLREEIQTAHYDAQLIERRSTDRVEHERQAMLAEATEAGERALKDAGRELERARAAARQRLRGELLQAALQLARRDAARLTSAALDNRLVDRFIGSLERIGHG